jgi:hypothetical protein
MESPVAILTKLLLAAVVVGSAADPQTIEVRTSSTTLLTGAEREHFLTAHNIARKSLGVAPVAWSNELGRHALESLQQQKDGLVEAAKEAWNEGRAVLPKHRAENDFGENIAGWVGSKSRPAEFAVELWLREKAAFDRLNASAPYLVGDEEGQVETDALGNERPVIVGHYTAIIWSRTEEIGAAKLTFELIDDQGTSRSYVAVICLYDPPGNRRGEKPY